MVVGRRRSGLEHRGGTALVAGEGTVTSGELGAAGARQAAVYGRLGVGRGDGVVCALGNCPEHLAAMGAAWACGAAHVAAGLGATAQDVAWLVGRVEARVLLAGRTAAEVPGDLPAAVRA